MSDIFGMPVHPAAELFPMLDDAELRELAEDIRANGLHEQPWVWDDPERGPVLLDGRNRLEACKLAGVRPTPRPYKGTDPIGFVWSENYHRRHLTTGQEAYALAGRERLYAQQAKAEEAERKRREIEAQRSKTEADRPQSDTDDLELAATEPATRTKKRAPQSRDKAAKGSAISGRSIARWKRVEREAPDLAEQVKAGRMALDRAERIIRDREAERARIEQARQGHRGHRGHPGRRRMSVPPVPPGPPVVDGECVQQADYCGHCYRSLPWDDEDHQAAAEGCVVLCDECWNVLGGGLT